MSFMSDHRRASAIGKFMLTRVDFICVAKVDIALCGSLWKQRALWPASGIHSLNFTELLCTW
jgi:hypothetical protein